MQSRSRSYGVVRWSVLLLLLVVATTGQVVAQTSTGSIKGTVKDASGPLPGVMVTATNAASGIKYEGYSREDGSFLLGNLVPGTYQLTTAMDTFTPASGTVVVQIGQTSTVAFTLVPTTTVTEVVTVTGAAVEVAQVRSSEIATVVTTRQIESLPQNSRNFLNFASLAPGVSVSASYGDDPRYGGATFRSGGQDARQVNVYVDGLSYKNDVIKGGAFMQDSSRGNPFPQAAVAEFQVLTQNYKAEYEKAAAAVITAVTKSGTNLYAGEAFLSYQNDSMVAKTEFQVTKPDYTRYQWGLSLGGPIQADRLFFYAAYEQNDQERFNTVRWDRAVPANLQSVFAPYEQGNLRSPFHSKLALGKLTWQPAVGQTGDITGTWRDESDKRDFGGATAFQSGVNQQVKTYGVTAQHSSVFGDAMNQATAFLQQMEWIQGAIDQSTPHLNYYTIGSLGGRDTIQNITQERYGVRDVLSYVFTAAGSHVAKGGVDLTWAKYDYDNGQNANPVFNFRPEDNWAFPFEARYGFGQSATRFSNRQYGIFIQDDWAVTPQLELNIGVRWDYESNMLNNDWVTPADIVAAANSAQGLNYQGQVVKLSDIINLKDYISTGSNRSSFKDAFQPRLGFSYDVFGTGKTVAFGAWGRYYDHVNLQDIYEEQHKYTWKFYSFCFTGPEAGANPVCGNPIQWQPSYLSQGALDNLIAQGVAGGPEIWMLNNNTKPPRTDQWTLGVRQALGRYQVGLSYANVRGFNGLIWWPAATPDATTDKGDRWGHLIKANGFGTILYSTSDRKNWYDAVYLTVDRPYSDGWGFNVAYTYARSKQLGNENKSEGIAFGFDFFQPSALRKVPGDNDERQKVVTSVIVGLPWEIMATSMITMSTGVPYTIWDFSKDASSIRWNEGRPERRYFLIGKWAYASLDLRLQKDFVIGGNYRLGLQIEGFNLTNFKSYCGYEGYYLSPNLGKPNCQYNQRKLQGGLKFSF